MMSVSAFSAERYVGQRAGISRQSTPHTMWSGPRLFEVPSTRWGNVAMTRVEGIPRSN